MKYLCRYKVFESFNEDPSSDIALEVKDVLCDLIDDNYFTVNVAYNKLGDINLIISIYKEGFKRFKWTDSLSDEILVNLKSHLSDRYSIKSIRGIIEVDAVLNGNGDSYNPVKEFTVYSSGYSPDPDSYNFDFFEIDVYLAENKLLSA